MKYMLYLLIMFIIMMNLAFGQNTWFESTGLDFYKVTAKKVTQNKEGVFAVSCNVRNGITWHSHFLLVDNNGTGIKNFSPTLDYYDIFQEELFFISDNFLFVFAQGSRITDGHRTSFSYIMDTSANLLWFAEDTLYYSNHVVINDTTLATISSSLSPDSITGAKKRNFFLSLKHIKKDQGNLYVEEIKKYMFSDTGNIYESINFYSKKLTLSFYIRSAKKLKIYTTTMQGDLISNNTLITDRYTDRSIVSCMSLDNALVIYNSANYLIQAFDSNLNMIWTLEDEAGDSWIEDAILSNSGKEVSFLIYYDSNDHYKGKGYSELLSVNNKGEIASRYQYKIDDNWFKLWELLYCNDGGFLMLGSYEDMHPYFSYLLKTDSLGHVESDIVKSSFLNETLLNNNDLTIYPNPFSNTSTVYFTSNITKANIQLYDFSGRLLRQESFRGKRYELNRGNLPPGIYLYTITTKDKIYSGKLMVAE